MVCAYDYIIIFMYEKLCIKLPAQKKSQKAQRYTNESIYNRVPFVGASYDTK